MRNDYISFKKLMYWKKKRNLVLMYLYATPGHKANVERKFSLLVSQWTKELNRLQVKTVESIIQCKFNCKTTCPEFHTYVTGKPELPKQVKSQKNIIFQIQIQKIL